MEGEPIVTKYRLMFTVQMLHDDSWTTCLETITTHETTGAFLQEHELDKQIDNLKKLMSGSELS